VSIVSIEGQRSAEVGRNCVQTAHSKFCSDSHCDHSDRLGLGQSCGNEGISVNFGYCGLFVATYCPFRIVATLR
jgi:hypothetical protein